MNCNIRGGKIVIVPSTPVSIVLGTVIKKADGSIFDLERSERAEK